MLHTLEKEGAIMGAVSILKPDEEIMKNIEFIEKKFDAISSDANLYGIIKQDCFSSIIASIRKILTLYNNYSGESFIVTKRANSFFYCCKNLMFTSNYLGNINPRRLSEIKDLSFSFISAVTNKLN